MYDRRSLYITWGGQIGSSGAGVDVWQTGLHISGPNDTAPPLMPDAADLQALYEDILTPFHSDINVGISQGAKMLFVKAAPLLRSGEYSGEALEHNGTAVAGAVTTDRGGPQDSLVVGLWSGNTLGQANYGRIYLPWNGIPVQATDARISNGAATNASIAGGDLIDDVNTWVGTFNDAAFRVRIMSKVGTGTSKLPAFVRVGNVVDTQRRRRNKVVETYFATPVA